MFCTYKFLCKCLYVNVCKCRMFFEISGLLIVYTMTMTNEIY